MKDRYRYISLNNDRMGLNDIAPEEWDKASKESSEKAFNEEYQKDWELHTRHISYGRASDYVDSDEPISDTPIQDSVNEPSHYLDVPKDYEHHRVMDAIGANYHFSNAMKYLWRAGKKCSKGMSIEDKEIQDVRKSIRYLEMWIELRQENTRRGELDGVK